MKNEEVIRRLEEYVNMPSGSHDTANLCLFVEKVASDLEMIGCRVQRIGEPGKAPCLRAELGNGKDTLLLIGHMDTVFPPEEHKRLEVCGDRVTGSGVMDMKGGLLILQEALRRAALELPANGRILIVLDPDEEIGAPAGRKPISEAAKESFACLSFEPMRENGAMIHQRKGVLSFDVRCTGIRGHAGSMYLKCASAIQQICAVVGRLYTLRDDSRDISVNVGAIRGGTVSNAVAGEASIRAEIRCYNTEYFDMLKKRVEEICAEPGIPGTTTELSIHPSHPPFLASEGTMRLAELVTRAARQFGIADIHTEPTGGAGDVSFAALAGIPALDCFGLRGGAAHTPEEYGWIHSFEENAELARRVILQLLRDPGLLSGKEM